jgi:hypothetical protein
MKKRGKELKMDLSDNYNIVYGTVDNKNAKAIYINISAWGEPLSEEVVDYGRIIGRLSKSMKQSTYDYLNINYKKEFYIDRSITDLDMRESGIRFGKRSFMNCEITIFHKEIIESINNNLTSEVLTNIVNEAIVCLDKFKYFSFNKKKD